MKSWQPSLPTILVANVLAFMSFLTRALLDLRYVYPDFFPSDSFQLKGLGWFYILIAGVWMGSILAATQRRKAPLYFLIALALLFLLVTGLGTFFFFCPFPCRVIWPVSEMINLSNILLGIFVPLVTGFYLRKRANQGGNSSHMEIKTSDVKS
jgi:hypothetical protein